MVSLSDLKKNSKKNLSKLIEESEKLSNKNFKREADPRFWQPSVDKAGNGFAVIRFLPGAKVDGPDALPWVRLYDFAFEGVERRWYIEKSLTTLGLPDPAHEHNKTLWNDGKEDQARKQKRREKYYSNILVVNDPVNPDNNGKVFLYRYGKKIFESKISAVMAPEPGLGEEPNDPFDFWNGQNFKLKIKQVGGFRNYDESNFAAPSPISQDDLEIEAIWNKQHSLKQFVDPKEYKSYEELKKHLDYVLGFSDTKADGTKASRTVEEMAAAVSTVSVAEKLPDETPLRSNEETISSGDIDIDALLADINDD